MNRDTFVDETIITLLRTSFVFWQRGTYRFCKKLFAVTSDDILWYVNSYFFIIDSLYLSLSLSISIYLSLSLSLSLYFSLSLSLYFYFSLYLSSPVLFSFTLPVLSSAAPLNVFYNTHTYIHICASPGHTSPDAQSYMRAHSVQETDLPHIAVIDSRTGAKIITMKG